MHSDLLQERDRINIMLLIIETANDASGYTDIIYTALFNDPRLKEYWQVLIHEGLLIYDSNSQRLKTTEKALSFLEAYKEIDYDMNRV
jgi:predicted transcriptional regulator